MMGLVCQDVCWKAYLRRQMHEATQKGPFRREIDEYKLIRKPCQLSVNLKVLEAIEPLRIPHPNKVLKVPKHKNIVQSVVDRVCGR